VGRSPALLSHLAHSDSELTASHGARTSSGAGV
jgi:hypothetical protein